MLDLSIKRKATGHRAPSLLPLSLRSKEVSSGRKLDNFSAKMPRMAFLAPRDRMSHRRGEKLSSRGPIFVQQNIVHLSAEWHPTDFLRRSRMESFDTKTTGTDSKSAP